MNTLTQARPATTGATQAPGVGLLATVHGDVTCVFARDPAARNLLEVLTIYPGVHAVILHRFAHRLWRLRLRYLARLLSFLTRALTQIDMHPGARIGQRFFIDHGCGVVIGETTEIGDDVTLYHGVTLGGTSWNAGKRHPTLCSGVIVGAGAKILGPISIGANTRIAANSVVIADVAANMTVVGIPGRVVRPKDRHPDAGRGIDLDHHRMPDPVGKALACVLERIDELERSMARRGQGTSETCGTCNEEDCIEATFLSAKESTSASGDHAK